MEEKRDVASLRLSGNPVDWLTAGEIERDEARSLVQRWYAAWHFNDVAALNSVYDETRGLNWIKHEDG